MGEILIRLRGNAKTGRKELLIDYESDPDLTSAEHERRHREIVEALVRDGVISREEHYDIVFREQSQAAQEADQSSECQG